MAFKEYLDIKTVEEFMSGNDEAFNKVYDRFHDDVYRLAYQFFRNDDKAKDIVQDTFLLVYKQSRSLKSPNAILSWIQRIAYCECLRYVKKDKVDTMGHLNEHTVQQLDNMKDHKVKNTLDKLQIKEAKKMMIHIIGEMKPEWRAIAYLRFFEDLSINEIAEVMDIKPQTVGVYIHRIKEVIRSKLRDKGYTKETCFTIVSTPLIIESYQDYLSDMKLPIKDNYLIKKSIKKRCIKSGYKIIKFMIFATLATSSTAVIMKNSNSIQNMIFPQDYAKISSIQYDKRLTNQSIKINVKTTNNNYDYVSINKKKTSIVHNNGNYNINIVKDNKVLDSKSIKIKNIDKEEPTILKKSYVGKKLCLEFSDKDSGVDYDSLILFINNRKSNAFEVINKKVFIQEGSFDHAVLHVSDYAGNVLKVSIDIYEY